MKKDTVVELKKPENITEDPLMEILRKGARELLARALEAEVEGFLVQFESVRDDAGKRMVTRNGYSPERNIQTGIGDLSVKTPRVADRRKVGPKIRFTSSMRIPVKVAPISGQNGPARSEHFMGESERSDAGIFSSYPF